jgi:hypothetical protein
MFSPAFKTRLATALAGAALASAMAVSGAAASHGYQPAEPESVPPPPSSIAASAVEEYQDLRNPDTRDLADGYAPGNAQDLRSPDTRDAAEGYQPELPTQPVADEPSEPSGFDFVSAAIGAIAAGALALVLVATLGLRRPPRGRPASA